MPFAEGERGLEGFEQARVMGGRDREAVLQDLDGGRELFQRSGWRFVGAEDLAVDEDAEISLLWISPNNSAGWFSAERESGK